MNDASPASHGYAKPLLFVISGPSGAGKGTALSHVQETFPQIARGVTYTTRDPRPNEVPGRDYNYISDEVFDEHLESGEIYEFAKTYGDYRYGSPRAFLDTNDDHLLVELEVKGMLRLRANSRRRVVSIFILPPSLQELRDRIVRRNDEKNVAARLQTALDQVEYAVAFDYVLMNRDIDTFRQALSDVINAEIIRYEGIVAANGLSSAGWQGTTPSPAL
ncbi:guanylate kinase [bacterium]|nr:MAG: guanylate kinase [bacterium]